MFTNPQKIYKKFVGQMIYSIPTFLSCQNKHFKRLFQSKLKQPIFFFSVQQMKLKNHSQSSNPTKLQLIQTVPTEQRQLCWGWDSRGAARGVFVLSATPTPCTGTRFSWTSPKSQECIKIKWISNPQNEIKSQRRIRLLCFILFVCLFKVVIF